MKQTSYRRRAGALFGAGLGLSYALVSQTINHIYLPGVPLYQPPLGPLGNIALWTLFSALLGWISAWSAEGIRDVFLSAGLGSLTIAALTFMSGSMGREILNAKILALVFLLVPLTAFLVPFIGIHRWAVNREVEFHITHAPLRKRLLLPLLLVIVVAGIGAISLYSAPARLQVTRMHAMLQSGSLPNQEADLPLPLQDELVRGFLEHAGKPYQLEWDNKRTNEFGIPRRMSSRSWEEAALIAHFEDGWMLVCLYPDSQAEPSCGSFSE